MTVKDSAYFSRSQRESKFAQIIKSRLNLADENFFSNRDFSNHNTLPYQKF